MLVDDGTGVIECVYRNEPQSPSKRKETVVYQKPKTIARVGWPLRVTGIVGDWREREIRITTIGELAYHNPQPLLTEVKKELTIMRSPNIGSLLDAYMTRITI